MRTQEKMLVIGACGWMGLELVPALARKFGVQNVLATDIHPEYPEFSNYRYLDVFDIDQVESVVRENAITQIYLLAAMLAGKGELRGGETWRFNVKSLLSTLEVANNNGVAKVFWPSSIAVFGPGSPKYNCPQQTRIETNSMYGISKRAGEYWCNNYFEQYGTDVRSLRLPELISPTGQETTGTTNYPVDIFKGAVNDGVYNCYLSEDNCLPMMYMPDAVRAVIELMDAPKESITIRTSYNIAAMSFSPCDLAAEIRKHIPGFSISYEPDFRNVVAYSLPASIKDLQARADWGWQSAFNLEKTTIDMLSKLHATPGKESGTVQSKDQQYEYGMLPG